LTLHCYVIIIVGQPGSNQAQIVTVTMLLFYFDAVKSIILLGITFFVFCI